MERDVNYILRRSRRGIGSTERIILHTDAVDELIQTENFYFGMHRNLIEFQK